MTAKTLSEEESETIYLMADFMRMMMYADGFLDLDNANSYKPNITDDYIRYGSAALKIYKDNKDLTGNPSLMRDQIIAAMAQTDGYKKNGKVSDQHKEEYSKYSMAVAVSILQYQRNPVRVTVSEEEASCIPKKMDKR